jgi:release factor glutamine methyltransferase
MAFVHSDLFSALPQNEQFDLIIWNPPFFQGKPSNDAELAWKAGDDYHVIRRFAESTTDRLSPNGRVILLLSTDMDMKLVLSIFQSHRFKKSLVVKRELFFETLFVYEFAPECESD